MTRRKRGENTSHMGNELLGIIERVERLEEEKADIASDIREVYSEAGARGFSIKTIRRLVRDRKVDEATRREEEAVYQMYKAAIGMLDGTPLGDAARKRLSGEDDEPEKPGDGERGDAPVSGNAITPEDIAKARDFGAIAAREGKRVVDNPYTANDPRRAAWDEGWCAETGTDGMDVPKAWRRKEKKKKDGKADGGEKPDSEGEDQ